MIDDAIAAREAEVLGEGPRIGPMAKADCPDDIVDLTSKLTRLASDRNPINSVDDVPEYFRTMFRHRDLCMVHSEMGIFLFSKGAIPARLRELVVLRVAWVLQAPYEWGEHVFVAHRIGMPDAEIERVREGADAPGWTAIEAALLRAVDELLDNAAIGDATWAALAAEFDEKQLIELPLLVGQYQGVAYLQNALRFRLHEGNKGLRAP